MKKILKKFIIGIFGITLTSFLGYYYYHFKVSQKRNIIPKVVEIKCNPNKIKDVRIKENGIYKYLDPVDKENLYNLLISCPKLVIFRTDWCSVCDVLEKNIESIVKNKGQPTTDIYLVNISEIEKKTTKEQFQLIDDVFAKIGYAPIIGVPTTIYNSKNKSNFFVGAGPEYCEYTFLGYMGLKKGFNLESILYE